MSMSEDTFNFLGGLEDVSKSLVDRLEVKFVKGLGAWNEGFKNVVKLELPPLFFWGKADLFLVYFLRILFCLSKTWSALLLNILI